MSMHVADVKLFSFNPLNNRSMRYHNDICYEMYCDVLVLVIRYSTLLGVNIRMTFGLDLMLEIIMQV